MEFKVISAPPGIKGDTAGSATKLVTIETGAQIKCPLFVNEGDIIRVNTETNDYVERVK
jgi:elongation factor P